MGTALGPWNMPPYETSVVSREKQKLKVISTMCHLMENSLLKGEFDLWCMQCTQVNHQMKT